MDAVRADDDLAEQARTERAEARRNLDSAVRRAYRHLVYLGQGDQDDQPRVDRTVAFEPDSGKTSLDGSAVWKALIEQGKAFDVSGFTAKALLLRLAPPKSVEPASTDQATDSTAHSTPTTSPTSNMATTHAELVTPDTAQPMHPQEREIAFSLMTSMSDPTTQDAVRRLLLELSNAADDGKISWAQLQVKVVVADEVGDAVEQGVRDAGTNPSSRPL